MGRTRPSTGEWATRRTETTSVFLDTVGVAFWVGLRRRESARSEAAAARPKVVPCAGCITSDGTEGTGTSGVTGPAVGPTKRTVAAE